MKIEKDEKEHIKDILVVFFFNSKTYFNTQNIRIALEKKLTNNCSSLKKMRKNC